MLDWFKQGNTDVKEISINFEEQILYKYASSNSPPSLPSIPSIYCPCYCILVTLLYPAVPGYRSGPGPGRQYRPQHHPNTRVRQDINLQRGQVNTFSVNRNNGTELQTLDKVNFVLALKLKLVIFADADFH